MTKLRVSPFVSLVLAPSGVFVRTDLAFFQIGGRDLKTFVSRLLPLLDGKRDRGGLLRALPDYSQESIAGALDLLEKHGVVERVSGFSHRWAGQKEFFRHWAGTATDPQAKLAQSRVLVIGLEPWGVECALELATAGVGALVLLDGERITEPLPGIWKSSEIGRQRRTALSRLIRDRTPECRVTSHPLRLSTGGRVQAPSGKFDLVVVATHRDDLGTLLGAARLTHSAGLRSLTALVDGLDAVVGPAVIPGRTGCWNCFRLRSLAHAEPLGETREFQAALLRQSRPSQVQHTYLRPMLPLLGHLTALEALKILSGYTPSKLFGNVIVQDLVTLQTSTHKLIRMPWCDVCGGAAAGGKEPNENGDKDDSSVAARVASAATPAELRESLAGWVDERIGVIRNLVAEAPDQRGPELPFTSAAMLAPYVDGRSGSGTVSATSGRGLTLVDAMRGAAAEGMERYSAGRYCRRDLVRCRSGELNGEALDARELFFYERKRYDDPDFPFAAYQPRQSIEWVTGSWMDNGRPVWVPALCAYYGYDAPPAEQFGQVTTNGLAAGRNPEDASLRSAFELIERDAFMLTWLARRPARALDIHGSLDPAALEIVRQLEQQGALVKIYLLDVGHSIPVALCVSYGDGTHWPGAAITLGCHLSAKAAAERAILEHGQSTPHLRDILESGEERIPASPDTVMNMMDHALYYFPKDRARAFHFLRECEAKPVTLDEGDEPAEISIAECARRLHRAGLRIAMVDVTSPDLKDGPFRVMRAVGPWFQPVDFGHKLQRLANPRLARWTRSPNPDPHPLA